MPRESTSAMRVLQTALFTWSPSKGAGRPGRFLARGRVRGVEGTRVPTDRKVVESSSTGALFMAVFGAIWAAAGAPAVGGATGTVLLLLFWTVAAALCVGAMRLRRAARGLPGDDSPQARARRGRIIRRFNLVFGLQGVAIALAVFLLVRYDLGTLVPAVVALIVGVHFFPLAGLYGVRAYHATGAALCVVGLAAFPLAAQSRLPVVGLGCAAVLLATAAHVLYFGRTRRPDTPAA